jgi:hypothetical protein
MVVELMGFKGSILLMIAIVFGVIATIVTYVNSRKLKGDVFEMPMVYFSLGILLSTISLIAVTFLGDVIGELAVGLIHDISFIVGLTFMLLASVKITRYLQDLGSFEAKLPKKK